MDTLLNGKHLITKLAEMRQQGQLKANTATALLSACRRVLSCLPEWENTELSEVRISEATKAFEDRFRESFSQRTVQTYKSRFLRALSLVSQAERVLSGSLLASASPGSTSSVAPPSLSGLEDGAEKTRPAIGELREPMIDFPFPLSDGRVAKLSLPGKLTPQDLRRLVALIKALYSTEDEHGTRVG